MSEETLADVDLGEGENTGDFIVDEEIPTDDIPVNDERPLISDPEWSDWVLSHLTEDEFFQGHPTVDGLRRIVPLILGPIIGDTTEVAQAPSKHNGMWATVVCTLTISSEYQQIEFSGAADAAPDNLQDIYKKFPTANAEARAESRALRKALRLSKIITAEEGMNEEEEEAFKNISTTQIDFIDKICARLNINVQKFANMGSQQYDNIKEVSHASALNMIKAINGFQQNPKSVPNDIINYANNWREVFHD